VTLHWEGYAFFAIFGFEVSPAVVRRIARAEMSAQ